MERGEERGKDEEENVPFFQNTLEEDTTMFNRIRDSLKISGDMFLLGKPSEKILDLLFKLYHENIIRNLKTSQENNKIRFMTGILELKNGDMYIAISEDPSEDQKPGNDYGKKIKMLYSLLKQSNVKVLFPEKNDDPKNQLVSYVKQTDLFPDGIYGWRTPAAANTYLPGVINRNELKGYANRMFIQEIDAAADAPNTKYNYDDDIWSNADLTINIIHSIDYLNKRKNEGFSFVPYKKVLPGKVKGSTVFECNNGSTCSEAKLFSYMYNNLAEKVKFEDIKGYIAYWVDNKLPPDHIIGGYCFSETNPLENKRLEMLTTDTVKLLNNETYDEMIKSYPDKFRAVIKAVVQPFALSCPGCFANYYPYTKNVMSKWDNSQCINSNRLKARASSTSGGRRGKSKRRCLSTRKMLLGKKGGKKSRSKSKKLGRVRRGKYSKRRC